MITKNDIVIAAYEELRISGLTAKPGPRDITSAVLTLDDMVTAWESDTICLNYNQALVYGVADPAQDTGVTTRDAYALKLNLAKALCARFGKQCPSYIITKAKETYDNLFSVVVIPKENRPYLPMGSGESYGYCGYRDYNRYYPKIDQAPQNCDTLNLKVGEINFFPLDFNYYLQDLETIASYTIDDGEGVEILSDSEEGGIITVEAEGLVSGYAPVLITLTTSNGRVNPETINFNIIIK